MTEPHDTPHVYENRPGTDWCRVCGEAPAATIHALAGMMRTTDGWAYPYESGRPKRPRFVRVGEDAWVDRKRVKAVVETWYSGTDTWQTRVTLVGGDVVTVDGRAADVIAVLNGEDLR